MKSIPKKFYILFFLFIGVCEPFSILTISAFSQDSLILGEFYVSKIIDGDSFKFEGLDKSVRLVGIDTEETFKGKNALLKSNDLALNWKEKYYSERLSKPKPVKIKSPFGFVTLQWTKDFFNHVLKVRLEIDSKERFVDTHNRYLVYLICLTVDGTEVNYNIECVRNGYSPYHTKYGYLKRYHKEFQEAQEYAKQNNLGIWNKDELCYPDYEERLEWWKRRAEAVKNFESKYQNIKNYFAIYNEKDFNALSNKVGKEIIIFGSVDEVYLNEEPYTIRLLHKRNKFIEAIVFEENADMLSDIQINNLIGEYVYIKGILSIYKGHYQIELTNKKQIWVE